MKIPIFCKWCNKEAVLNSGGYVTCDLCKYPFCNDHSSIVTTSARNLLEATHRIHLSWKNYLYKLIPDPDIPKEEIAFSDGTVWSGFYKNYFENVFPKVNFENIPVSVCKYCDTKATQKIKEVFFPVFQSVKDLSLICAYNICPFDTERICENCGKKFCFSHSVRCSRCNRVFCCSLKYESKRIVYGGCQKDHTHQFEWLLGRKWVK